MVHKGCSVPFGGNALAGSAFLELFHRGRANVLEVVGARVRNDLIPDDGRVGAIVGCRPVGRDIDEDLLGVPSKEGLEVCVKGESENGVFLLF